MKINFTKMHGIGNDYIYIDCLKEDLAKDPSELAIKMSPRHFSVGADGVVLICPSDVADAKMRMFNADGSEGRMCGNAIRCVGKYLYDNRVVNSTHVTIETLSGIKTLDISLSDGVAVGASVDMGIASFDPASIPVISDDEMIASPLTVCGREYRLTAVSMGNPHAVIFLPEVASLDLEAIGPHFENLPIFPERVNTEFVRVIDERTLEMRVWERGSGETFACGTGSCATVAAAVRCGYCKAGDEVTVRLLGGELAITCGADYRMIMRGGAEKVYEGVYEI